MKLSEKILKIRKSEGLSQEEFADKLEVSRQAVYKWESGMATPEIEKLKAIHNIFGTSIEYLLNDDIDTIDAQGVAKKTQPERGVFVSKKAFHLDPKWSYKPMDADRGYVGGSVDNCYIECTVKPNKPDWPDKSPERMKKTEKALKEIGATDIIPLQYTDTFFFDSNKNVFGFFSEGEVRFACPLENLLNFDFNTEADKLSTSTQPAFGIMVGAINGVGVSAQQRINVERGTKVNVRITYKDGNQPAFWDFAIDVQNYLDIYIVPRDVRHLHERVYKEKIIDNLLKAKTLLEMRKAENIDQVYDLVDWDVYALKNKETKSEYDAYIDGLKAEATAKKKKKWIKRLIILGVVVVVAVICVIAAPSK